MYIRKLQKEDVSSDSDFIRILSQLSMSDRDGLGLNFLWSEYERQSNTHVIVVVDNDLVIGTGSGVIKEPS